MAMRPGRQTVPDQVIDELANAAGMIMQVQAKQEKGGEMTYIVQPMAGRVDGYCYACPPECQNQCGTQCAKRL
jgi:Cys-rich peptide (Clo7bot family)